MNLLLIKNLDQLAQVCAKNEVYKSGSEQNVVALLSRKSSSVGVSIVINERGLIKQIGFDDEIDRNQQFNQVIDGFGCSLIPGLIDPHTHPVWSGTSN